VTIEGLTPKLTVTWNTPKHTLQDIWLLATDCAIELRVEDGGENLFAIDQATSELTLNSGVAPGTYTFSVIAYLKDYPDASDMSYTSPTSTIEVGALTPNLDCSNTEIVAQNDLVIEHITSGSADPTEIVFDEFQDLAAVSEGNASLCGPRAYSLAFNTIDATLDAASRTIKV